MRIVVALIIMTVIVGVVFADETMTVDDVIELYEEGVSISVIKASIDTKDAIFDLSTDDIKDLHKANVPDELITYMLSRKPGQDSGEGEGVVSDTENGDKVKVGTITVDMYVDYGISSKNGDINLYFALGIDDKIKFSQVSWDKKYILGEGHQEVYRYLSSFVKSVSVSTSKGDHEVSLYLWTGEGRIDENNLSPYEIYSKTVHLKSGGLVNLDLNVSSDEDGDPIVSED